MASIPPNSEDFSRLPTHEGVTVLWEYWHSVSPPEKLDQYLDLVGSHGWELISCTIWQNGEHRNYDLILKRPRKPGT